MNNVQKVNNCICMITFIVRHFKLQAVISFWKAAALNSCNTRNAFRKLLAKTGCVMMTSRMEDSCVLCCHKDTFKLEIV